MNPETMANSRIAEMMAELYKKHLQLKEEIIKKADELKAVEDAYEVLFVEFNKRVKDENTELNRPRFINK